MAPGLALADVNQCQSCVKWREYANSQKETEKRVKEAEELNAQWKEYADTLKAQLDENSDIYTEEVQLYNFRCFRPRSEVQLFSLL